MWKNIIVFGMQGGTHWGEGGQGPRPKEKNEKRKKIGPPAQRIFFLMIIYIFYF